MALHTDIPSRNDLKSLLAVHEPCCVSIYMSTTPTTSDADAERIAFKNAAADAVAELEANGAPRDAVAAIDEQLSHLVDDEVFWDHQAISLAVFATPSGTRTYRLPNRLGAMVVVGDRFVVKPLLRTVTFPQAAFVLALAQGSVRLIEISPDLPPHVVDVPDLPTDVASAAGKTSMTDRNPRGAVQGGEGQKIRMRQFARQIDQALRPVLSGIDRPLILAAAQPLESIYRSVNSYPGLIDAGIEGNPEATADQDLAAEARRLLDGVYDTEVAATLARLDEFGNRGRSATEIGDVARAATFGAVDTVLVDIEADVPGEIDETTGAIEMGPSASGGQVIDEIARRVLLAGGRVLAVRGEDLGERGAAVAILRYPV
jgi:Bacterial archaeo-eukaryotic release factor family 11